MIRTVSTLCALALLASAAALAAPTAAAIPDPTCKYSVTGDGGSASCADIPTIRMCVDDRCSTSPDHVGASVTLEE